MSWLTKKISREYSDKAVRPFASTEKTLEVGAYGRPSYGQFFPNRVGVDIRQGPGVDVVASVYEMPFRDEEFQNVLCMSVLEHLENPPKAVKEMYRVLAPGGRILVSVPFLFPIHDAPGDYWRFTKYGLQHLFRDGWTIEQLTAETDTQQSLAVLLQRIGYQTRLRADKFTKGILFLAARCLNRLPRMTRNIYGDIHKKIEEPGAFTSAYFMVAQKKHEAVI